MNVNGNKINRLQGLIRIGILLGTFGIIHAFTYFYFKFVNPSEVIKPFFDLTFQNALQSARSIMYIIAEMLFSSAIAFNNIIKLSVLGKISRVAYRKGYRNIEKRLLLLKSELDRTRSLDLIFTSFFSLENFSNSEKLKFFELMLLLGEAGFLRIYSISTDAFTMKNCQEALLQACLKSNEVFISGIAQYEFVGKYCDIYRKNCLNNIESDDIFFRILRDNERLKLRIMLINPEDPSIDRIVKNRIEDIGKIKMIDKTVIEKYKDDTRTTVKFLNLLKKDGFDIDYEFFNDEPIFRYYITDSKLFFSQYIRNYEGHESVVFEIDKKDTSLFNSFTRLFNKRWEKFKKYSESYKQSLV